MSKPSDHEQAEWPDATREYVEKLERIVEHLQDRLELMGRAIEACLSAKYSEDGGCELRRVLDEEDE